MVVIHPNGAVEPIRMNTKVAPADIIVVPTKYIVRQVQTDSTFQQWMRTIIAVAAGALLL